MKRILAVAAAILLAGLCTIQGQDLSLYKKIVKNLSSPKFQGRGYALDGANKAGRYLQKEYRRAGADEVVLQPFTLDINTFAGKMALSVDGRRLAPGKDFTVREYNPSLHGTYPLYYIDTLNYDSAKIFADLAREEYKDAFVVCDFWFSYKHGADFKKIQAKDGPGAGVVFTWEEPLKFYKAYGETVHPKAVVWVGPGFPKDAKSITASMDNRFYKDYECFNVIAKVEGARHDSCYVFTAHYDHLGNLGRKVFYAGANDNASGSAAIVTLAKHFAAHRPPFDMYFVAFSGEDANLRGSEFFADNPVVPLGKIKYLFNIDMVGDNCPSLYCECSDEGTDGYELFDRINSEKGYFRSLDRGKLAANSDHYPFAKRHVPCIFLENKNGDAFQYYHTPQDNYKNAVFDTYEPLFRLVVDFVEKYR